MGGQPPRPFRGGPMHHMGGPMGPNNMSMGPRAPAPMMGSMGPGPRVGRGGMPGPGKIQTSVQIRYSSLSANILLWIDSAVASPC